MLTCLSLPPFKTHTHSSSDNRDANYVLSLPLPELDSSSKVLYMVSAWEGRGPSGQPSVAIGGREHAGRLPRLTAVALHPAELATSRLLIFAPPPPHTLGQMGVNHVGTGLASFLNIAPTDPIQRLGLDAWDDQTVRAYAHVLVCTCHGLPPQTPSSALVWMPGMTRRCVHTRMCLCAHVMGCPHRDTPVWSRALAAPLAHAAHTQHATLLVVQMRGSADAIMARGPYADISHLFFVVGAVDSKGVPLSLPHSAAAPPMPACTAMRPIRTLLHATPRRRRAHPPQHCAASSQVAFARDCSGIRYCRAIPTDGPRSLPLNRGALLILRAYANPATGGFYLLYDNIFT